MASKNNINENGEPVLATDISGLELTDEYKKMMDAIISAEER